MMRDPILKNINKEYYLKNKEKFTPNTKNEQKNTV